MRVLVLSQYYYPEPVLNVHDMARRLVGRGHKVEVITGFPCYPGGETYPGYHQSPFFAEKIDGVQVLRVPQFPDHSRSALRRAVYYLSFLFTSVVLGPIRAQRPDVIVVYMATLPIGLAGWALGRMFGVPVVQDIVDLWPESVVASGMLTNRLIVRFLYGVAKFIYARAAHIVTVTNGYKRNIMSLGVPETKVTVIYNWMPADEREPGKRDEAEARRMGLDGCFVVMYAGNMGISQNIGTVLQAAERLRDLSNVKFALVGHGLQHDELVAYARDKALNNIIFLGRKLAEEMTIYYAIADVLLVHLKPDALSDITIPSKTFSYLPAGRPLLMAVRGEAEEFMAANKIGIAIPPSDPKEMERAVRWFHAQPRSVLDQMGRIAYARHKETYCSNVQFARMDALLSQFAGERNRSRGFIGDEAITRSCVPNRKQPVQVTEQE